jgi:hypothetical protein
MLALSLCQDPKPRKWMELNGNHFADKFSSFRYN